MRIGGFVKNSLVDWEGKITAVVFTKGCNFRCGYCHNPSLVLPELIDKAEDIAEETVLDFLAERNNWLDGVVVTGGEPTIHKDLPSFIMKIREMNYKIKLDTNGSNPFMIRGMLNEKLIDCIAIDVKTILKEEEYIKITGCDDPDLLNCVVETIKIVKGSDIEKIFRTTVLLSHHNNDIVNSLRSELKDENYILQPFREGITLSDFLNRKTLQNDKP